MTFIPIKPTDERLAEFNPAEVDYAGELINKAILNLSEAEKRKGVLVVCFDIPDEVDARALTAALKVFTSVGWLNVKCRTESFGSGATRLTRRARITMQRKVEIIR